METEKRDIIIDHIVEISDNESEAFSIAGSVLAQLLFAFAITLDCDPAAQNYTQVYLDQIKSRVDEAINQYMIDHNLTNQKDETK